METTLRIKTTQGIAEQDTNSIDLFIDKIIAKHRNNSEMMNVMALEASSLAQSVSSRGNELKSQGFLSRLWGDITGNNQKISASNDVDLARSQYLGQQVLNKLAENNLMTYQMITALGDQINRTASDVCNLEHELAELQANLALFFKEMRSDLDVRFNRLERNDTLLFWKESLEFLPVYFGKTYSQLTCAEKIVCLANDIYCKSKQEWGAADLAFFKSVMTSVGHHPDEPVILKEVFQEYQENPQLLDKLFEGIDDDPILTNDCVITPTLMAFGKLKSLDTNERDNIDRILEYVPQMSREAICLNEMKNYLRDTVNRDIDNEVSFFDAVMNLVEDLLFYTQLQKSDDYYSLLKNDKFDEYLYIEDVNVCDEDLHIKYSDCIGIDFGSSNIRVAVLKNGVPEIVKDYNGDTSVPCVVSFTEDGDILVGNKAKQRLLTNPDMTIDSLLTYAGYNYDSFINKFGINKTTSYQFIKANNGNLLVSFNGKNYSIPQLIAKLIRYVLEMTADFIGKDNLWSRYLSTVISMPDSFHYHQRQAIINTAKLLDLRVRIISSSSCVALSLGDMIIDDHPKQYVIFDFGAKYLNMSIVETDIVDDEKTIEVIGKVGVNIGGSDIDKLIEDYIVKQIKKSNGIDLSNNVIVMTRIRYAAEKAKIELSNSSVSYIDLPYLYSTPSGYKNIHFPLYQSDLVLIIEPLINRCINELNLLIESNDISIDDIDDIVLTGKQSHMPLIKEKINDFFNKEPRIDANLDMRGAIGAVIQAGIYIGNVKSILLLDTVS